MSGEVEGVIGAGQPCWVVAIPIGEQWAPLLQIHQCDEQVANAIVAGVVERLTVERIALAPHAACEHVPGTIAFPDLIGAQGTIYEKPLPAPKPPRWLERLGHNRPEGTES